MMMMMMMIVMTMVRTDVDDVDNDNDVLSVLIHDVLATQGHSTKCTKLSMAGCTFCGMTWLDQNSSSVDLLK